MADTIAWVEDPEGFSALAEPWERMLGDGALPFDRHCWFESWRKAFAPDRQLAVCTVSRDGELVGVLPMVRAGSTLHAMANVHTPAFRPLARDAAALEAVLDAALGARAALVELVGVASADASLALAERRAASAGRSALVERQHLSPLVDTRGNFDDWVKETKPRWEANIPRFRRKMARDWEAEFDLMSVPSDLDRALERGFQTEASGWKGREGTAIVSAADTARFYREVARAFHERGELRLSTILLDGEAVAFDLCLLDSRRLYLLKTGFDERYRKVGPGLVLRLMTIERCFEEGLESHELLGDDAPWKRKFATGSRLHETLRAYSRGPRGRVRHGYRAWARPRLRDLYRKTLARRRS